MSPREQLLREYFALKHTVVPSKRKLEETDEADTVSEHLKGSTNSKADVDITSEAPSVPSMQLPKLTKLESNLHDLTQRS